MVKLVSAYHALNLDSQQPRRKQPCIGRAEAGKSLKLIDQLVYEINVLHVQ